MADFDTTPITYGVIAFAFGACTVAASAVIWINAKLKAHQDRFFRVISKHNREDDEILGDLADNIWNIIARNAYKDGSAPPQRISPRKRRYLIDDGDKNDGGDG